MCFSQENRFLLSYCFGKFFLNTCSYVTKSRISDPTASKIRFFMTLVNGSKPFTNITKRSILDVAGSKISVCYLIFYWIVVSLFRIRKQWVPQSPPRKLGLLFHQLSKLQKRNALPVKQWRMRTGFLPTQAILWVWGK